VTAFVPGDDLQPCSYSETKYGDQRIFKPDAVYIVFTSVMNEFSGGLVTTQEAIENGTFDLGARHNLLRQIPARSGA